jgi:hypothetical protein
MLVVAAGRALLTVLLRLRTRLLHLLRMKLLTRRLLGLRLRSRLRARLLRLLRVELLTRCLLSLWLRTWFRTRLLLDLRPLDRFGVLRGLPLILRRMRLLPRRRIFHGAPHLA